MEIDFGNPIGFASTILEDCKQVDSSGDLADDVVPRITTLESSKIDLLLL